MKTTILLFSGWLLIVLLYALSLKLGASDRPVATIGFILFVAWLPSTIYIAEKRQW